MLILNSTRIKQTPLDDRERLALLAATDPLLPADIRLSAMTAGLVLRFDWSSDEPLNLEEDDLAYLICQLPPHTIYKLWRIMCDQMTDLLAEHDTDEGCSDCGQKCSAWRARREELDSSSVNKIFQDIISRG